MLKTIKWAARRVIPFEMLYQLSLNAMEYGYGGYADSSGEALVIERVGQKAGPLTVFDVGANVGHYARLVQKILGSRAEIYCFEPATTTRAALLKKIAGLKGITVLPFGCGDEEKSMDLHMDCEASTSATVYKDALVTFGTESKFVDTVKIRRLDVVAKELGISHIDLLKIDVEGHEMSALLGCGDLLASGAVRAIQFEFGPFHIHSRTFLKDFFDLLKDYRISRVTTDRLIPLDKWDASMEIFMTANYMAEWTGGAGQNGRG